MCACKIWAHEHVISINFGTNEVFIENWNFKIWYIDRIYINIDVIDIIDIDIDIDINSIDINIKSIYIVIHNIDNDIDIIMTIDIDTLVSFFTP